MNPRCLSLCLALSLLTVPAWATPEDAVAYANTLAFTDKADRLRSAFDRWDRIVRENTFLEENVYKRGFLYGYQFDLAPNIGALGLAYGQKRLRFYGLGYTTELQAWTRDDYQRAAGGLNVNFDWVQLQAEANAGDGGLFYFGKVSSAPLQTACTIALDPFEETNTDGLVLAGGGSAKPNRFGCETSIIPGVSRLGTDVDVVLNYVKPSLTISLSGILNVVSADEDVLGKTPFDVELRLSSRMKEMDDFSDFTAILTLYLVKEGSFLKSKGLGIANLSDPLIFELLA